MDNVKGLIDIEELQECSWSLIIQQTPHALEEKRNYSRLAIFGPEMEQTGCLIYKPYWFGCEGMLAQNYTSFEFYRSCGLHVYFDSRSGTYRLFFMGTEVVDSVCPFIENELRKEYSFLKKSNFAPSYWWEWRVWQSIFPARWMFRWLFDFCNETVLWFNQFKYFRKKEKDESGK